MTGPNMKYKTPSGENINHTVEEIPEILTGTRLNVRVNCKVPFRKTRYLFASGRCLR